MTASSILTRPPTYSISSAVRRSQNSTDMTTLDGTATSPDDRQEHDLPAVCRRINAKLAAFLARPAATERLRSVQEHTRISLFVIARALEVYGLEHIALSFNGGKDCLVLLILLLAVLDEYFTAIAQGKSFSAAAAYPATPESVVTASTPPSLFHPVQTDSHAEPTPLPSPSEEEGENTPPTPNTPASSNGTSHSSVSNGNGNGSVQQREIQTVYIHSSHPFAEVDSFVARCVREYHLALLRYDENKGMKAAFRVYLAQNPAVRAVFVGTRRTDPHGGSLRHFDMTDGGWPAFMRCHPVIDWCYADVWGFLRELEIPYCPLYDLGYTSLGGTTDTHPNPALQRGMAKTAAETNGEATAERRKSLSSCFRPAYELDFHADEQERLGRDR
ncbi:hypothetical protein Dda_6178 [Drechslerella dactyloides]|uniref:FAD synthase n=1 Tax=Drechslerella dactyloides TaxID=74499 RepID=A0AAD6IWL0_DREDA|nr:hypothetical protein Dda_6178 [Drechslerella dactyloides]